MSPDVLCVCVGVLVCAYIVAGAADAALLFYTSHVRLARCQAEIVTASCNCDRHWMAYHNVYGATRLRHHLAVEDVLDYGQWVWGCQRRRLSLSRLVTLEADPSGTRIMSSSLAPRGGMKKSYCA